MNTVTWLHNNLVLTNNKSVINRLGRQWESVAGFSQMGSIFCIYKDAKEYCVHAGEEWEEGQEPLLGYYDIKLNWDELIVSIAHKYDSIRKSN